MQRAGYTVNNSNPKGLLACPSGQIGMYTLRVSGFPLHRVRAFFCLFARRGSYSYMACMAS